MPRIRQTILPPLPPEDFRARRHERNRRAQRAAPEKQRPRAKFNLIPSPDLLSMLIDDAVEALARGITWDRGAIVNIVL